MRIVHGLAKPEAPGFENSPRAKADQPLSKQTLLWIPEQAALQMFTHKGKILLNRKCGP